MGLLYFVRDDNNRHVMTAPLSTIAEFYELHPDAVRRVENETVRLDGVCVLAFGSRELGGVERIYIQRLPEEIPSARWAEPTPASEDDDPKTQLRENLP